MNILFNSCHKAIDLAVKTKTFGLFYSETTAPNLSVHVHDCCEIFLSLSDGNNFLINDKIYEVKAGNLFIINGFEAHKVSANDKDKFVRFSLHVHPEFIRLNSTEETNFYECFFSQKKRDKFILKKEQTEKFIALFNELSISREQGDDVYKKIKVLEILLEIKKLCEPNEKNETTKICDDALELAVNYINENFTERITLNDVAKNAFISTNRLCFLFKTLLSTTVNKYIISKKIVYAKKLLSEGKNVTETAVECGFGDYANFIRTFKKEVGVPPGKYRKTYF